MDHLHFEVMIARPQGAQLRRAPLIRLFRNTVRIGSVQTSPLLRIREIALPSVPLIHAPSGTLSHDRLKGLPVQLHEPPRPDARGDQLK